MTSDCLTRRAVGNITCVSGTCAGWQVFSLCPRCGYCWGVEALKDRSWEGQHPPEMDFYVASPDR